jgi:hypothetical protein
MESCLLSERIDSVEEHTIQQNPWKKKKKKKKKKLHIQHEGDDTLGVEKTAIITSQLH